MTILDEIISFKKEEIAESRNKFPESRLKAGRLFTRKVLPMTDSLLNSEKTGIIAEFKRMSPSKGTINADCSLEEVVTGYFRCGASGLSVLTDNHFFGGSNNDLKRARELTSIPLLRKDFIIDPYQITEARAIGADVVLIIAAAVTRSQAHELASYARSLDLQVLLEVHNSNELNYISEDVNIVGVNNRDLKTFKIDTEVSVNLAYEIPAGFLKISESGITSPLVYKKLKGCGYNGFLIGENFMRTPEPARAFADFVELITS